jgi:hypothetical protein
MTWKSAVLLGLALCLAGGTTLAVDLGEAIVKTVAVGAVVTAIADPADDAINTLTGNRSLPAGIRQTKPLTPSPPTETFLLGPQRR